MSILDCCLSAASPFRALAVATQLALPWAVLGIAPPWALLGIAPLRALCGITLLGLSGCIAARLRIYLLFLRVVAVNGSELGSSPCARSLKTSLLQPLRLLRQRLRWFDLWDKRLHHCAHMQAASGESKESEPHSRYWLSFHIDICTAMHYLSAHCRARRRWH